MSIGPISPVNPPNLTYIDWRANFMPAVSVGSIMQDVNRNLLHGILDGVYAENSTFTGANRTLDKANFDKMKTAYNACMNEDAIKDYGVTPLRKILLEFEAVYPLTAANASNDELTNTLIWLAKNSVSGLVSAGTGVSFHSMLILSRFVTVKRPTTKTLTQSSFRLVVEKWDSQSSTTTSRLCSQTTLQPSPKQHKLSRVANPSTKSPFQQAIMQLCMT
jgi:hypothetical protein